MDRFAGLRTPAQWAIFTVGAGYLLIGIAGYIGPLVTDDADGRGLLLGVFAVDGIHNVVHIAAGAAAMLLAMRVDTARWGARIFGVLFLGLALWGFGLVGAAGGETEMLAGLMHVNPADNWLHLATGTFFLALGFAPLGWTERTSPLGDREGYSPR